ncbi:hypothetical protein AMTRI_Chr12g273140 [Amborella trichopoda]
MANLGHRELADFLTLGYTSLVLVLTVPALSEKYEDHIASYAEKAYTELLKFYVKLDEECFSKIRKSIHPKTKSE